MRRDCDRLFSVGATNTVTLAIRAPPDASLLLRDDAPTRMLASAQLLTVRGTGSVSYTLTPRARGDADFGNVHVRSRGPWGLGTRDFSAAEPQTVRVDADISAVRVYEALARRGQLQELACAPSGAAVRARSSSGCVRRCRTTPCASSTGARRRAPGV